MGLFSSINDYINTGRAGAAVSNSNIAAEHGVLGAVSNGQNRIDSASASGQAGVGHAVDMAGAYLGDAKHDANGAIDEGTSGANSTLQQLLESIRGYTNAYTDAGSQGVKGLQDYVGSKPTFQFNPNDYINSDAYKYQLKQGQDAIQNTASAGGLGQSGAALKELTQFGQGLASTYYNDAFTRAKSTFDTNQNTTLTNLKSLIDAGEFGTNQINGASTLLGGQQAKNTFDAGALKSGNNMTIGQLLSSIGLQGAEFNSATGSQGAAQGANLGLQGSKLAGDYAVGAGEARAGSILGQGSALNGIVSGASPLLKMIPGLGGKVGTTLVGMLGGK